MNKKIFSTTICVMGFVMILLTPLNAFADKTGSETATAVDKISACSSATQYANTSAGLAATLLRTKEHEPSIRIGDCECGEISSPKGWWKCLVKWKVS